MKKLFLAALMALPLTAFAQKFAHVNTMEILQQMPEFTKAQTELQALSQQKEDELKRMQDELNAKVEDYEKNQATMPDAVRQNREQELNEINNRLRTYYETSQQELNQVQQKKMEEITTKITAVIKEIGEAGGYVYIMDVTSGIPFINEKLSEDVTAKVKAKLGLK